MSHTLSNAEIDQRFKQAYALVNGSLGSKDIAQLDQGHTLMRDTAKACLEMGKLEMMADGVRHVRGCITYPMMIEGYIKKNVPEAYLDRLLHYFSPYSNDILRVEKSTIDADEKLVKSFIRLDAIDDFSSMLRKFGMSGSRKAFALALDETLKTLELGTGGNVKALSVPVLTQIEAYKTSPTAKTCLPKEVLDVVQRYPLQLLNQHLKYRHQREGGFLRLEILDALLTRASCDEVLTDVVLEIAGNSAFKLDAYNHLIWIEETTGKVIGPERLKREVQDSSKDSDARIAMLYYMLCSPHFPADEISTALRLPSYMYDPTLYVEAMKLAVQHQAQPSELFDTKAAKFIKTMYKRDENTALKLIVIPGIPRRRLMDEPVLRDLIMAGDLGL